MSSSSQPYMTTIILMTVVLGGLWATGYIGLPASASTAQLLATGLQKLPVLDATTLSSINSAPGASSINSAINDINARFGTNFGPLNATAIDIAETFIPVLQPYNNLITASDKFKNNRASVDAIYEDAFFLGATAILTNALFAYHFSFNTVGIMNDLLKIGILQKYCEECYPIVLHDLYVLVYYGTPFLLAQFIKEFPTAPQV